MNLKFDSHGNRFKLEGDHFYMDGCLEDIPHYIAKLSEIAPKTAEVELRRHTYLPAASAVIAVQWDGTAETRSYLAALCSMRYCDLTVLPGSRTINIAMRGDYQGGVNYAIGDWAVFEPNKKYVSYHSDGSFRTKYIKVPMEG